MYYNKSQSEKHTLGRARTKNQTKYLFEFNTTTTTTTMHNNNNYSGD